MSYKLECEMNDEILKLRKQLEDARKDSNDEHGWVTHWCNRATKAERQLDIAVEALKWISKGQHPGNWRERKLADDALAAIEKVNNE